MNPTLETAMTQIYNEAPLNAKELIQLKMKILELENILTVENLKSETSKYIEIEKLKNKLKIAMIQNDYEEIEWENLEARINYYLRNDY